MEKSELADLLRDLAAQLGTTAEHLWTVLVRQAAVSAGMSVVWAVALLTAGVYLLRQLRKFDDSCGVNFDRRQRITNIQGSAVKTTRIALVAALLVSLAGCSQPNTNANSTSTRRGIAGGEIETVEHNGHLFTVWAGYRAGGIIHSPSCPCQVASK